MKTLHTLPLGLLVTLALATAAHGQIPVSNYTSDYYGNTGAGTFALTSLAASNPAQDNSAFGSYALTQNTTGSYNAAFGAVALSLNSTGSSNTAAGWGALLGNSTGSSNTAVGAQSLIYESVCR